MPDTIAAIATASAAAAVGIVRLSGAETRRVLAALFTPVNGRSAAELPPRRMTYGTVCDAEGHTLDHALAVVFSAGHSYTGEESAELHCHGSPVVLQEVLRAAFAAGARQARAGEFTERAFLNGKMDLTEAEAVIDLIDAETAEAARNAAAMRPSVASSLGRPSPSPHAARTAGATCSTTTFFGSSIAEMTFSVSSRSRRAPVGQWVMHCPQ